MSALCYVLLFLVKLSPLYGRALPCEPMAVLVERKQNDPRGREPPHLPDAVVVEVEGAEAGEAREKRREAGDGVAAEVEGLEAEEEGQGGRDGDEGVVGEGEVAEGGGEQLHALQGDLGGQQ